MLPERFLLGVPSGASKPCCAPSRCPTPSCPGSFPTASSRSGRSWRSSFSSRTSACRPPARSTNDTWDAIASVYRGVVARTRLPRGADVYPSPSFRVEPGGETLHLLVVQSMFKSLSHVLDEVQDAEVDGRHADGTAANTLWLQGRGNLEESGVFDNLSWELLTRLYAIFITRNLSVE